MMIVLTGYSFQWSMSVLVLVSGVCPIRVCWLSTHVLFGALRSRRNRFRNVLLDFSRALKEKYSSAKHFSRQRLPYIIFSISCGLIFLLGLLKWRSSKILFALFLLRAVSRKQTNGVKVTYESCLVIIERTNCQSNSFLSRLSQNFALINTHLSFNWVISLRSDR